DAFGNPTMVISKERLLRRAAGWHWRYPVHELLFSDSTVLWERIADVAIKHRPHDVESSVKRNGPMLRAWLRQLEKTGVSGRDLYRARFLVGRWLRATGQHERAAHWMLAQFLAKHPEMPPDDKREGWMDVAKAFIQAG